MRRLLALAALLSACGDRTGLGYQRSDGPVDGAVEGTGGATGEGGATLPQGTGGARPTGSGGARPGAGGASVVVGAGGYVAAAGGAPSSSGGYLAATGGAGGAPEAVDAGPEAGPNYCDPAVQCHDDVGAICHGVIWCGHGQTIDCSLHVTCAAGEFCQGADVPLPPAHCVPQP